MPNRDYDDSQYNRYDARDRDDWRDQSNRGSRDWERRNDDSRRDFSNQGREDYSSDYGNRSGERGFAQYGQYGQRPEQQNRNWFDERRDAQRLDFQQDQGRYQGGYRQQGGSYGSSQSGTGSSQSNYGRDWGHSGSYGQSNFSNRPDYSRTQSNYGARDAYYSQPYQQGGSGRQDWSQRAYAQGVSDWGDRGDRGDWGRQGGHEQRGQDDENWGQQLRHGVQQMASRVKRAFRGPKGYKRSDERIREDVSDRLALQDDVDPSDIEVSVSGGEVTLTGTVMSRREKFVAEEIADDVSGVSDVHNQLRVRREDQQANTLSGVGTSTTATQSSETPRNRNAPRA